MAGVGNSRITEGLSAVSEREEGLTGLDHRGGSLTGRKGQIKYSSLLVSCERMTFLK